MRKSLGKKGRRAFQLLTMKCSRPLPPETGWFHSYIFGAASHTRLRWMPLRLCTSLRAIDTSDTLTPLYMTSILLVSLPM